MSAQVRILIAEDHDRMRRGLKGLLESRPGWQICGEAHTGHEALIMTEELKQGKNAPPCTLTLSINRLKHASLVGSVALLAIVAPSCGPGGIGVVQPQNLCNCLPVEPDIADYRHTAKHVAIPNTAAEEITVDTILSWPQDEIPLPPEAPRTGRELRVFHVAQAFLQEASVNPADCDVHLEISQTADKNAPRVIVETPVDSEYCSARTNTQSQLAKHGFRLDAQHGGELPQALPAEILGMAFEDFEHNRGSAQVATLWELHPATLNLLP